MRQLGTLSLIVCLAAASGCNICCWGKRASELGSPTDIRKSHFWCLGEDAVFEQPCGPSREDYGLKPTCWREWPAGGARCLDGSCGPAMPAEAHFQGPQPTRLWEPTLPNGTEQESSPFQDDSILLPAPTGNGALLKRLPSSELPQIVPPGGMPARMGSGINTHAVPGQISSAKKLPLRITVSEPIDSPVRFLPPVEAPRAAARAVVPMATRPAAEAQTLAGLEQMIEVPTAASTTPAEPAVVKSDHETAPPKFRLTTRESMAASTEDPALEKKTLAALKKMM